MVNFNYYTPTKVVFGKDTEEQVGQLCLDNKATTVLIHYGSGSVVRSGLLDRVKNSLKNKKINFIELGGVVPNPRLSLVKQGVKLCLENNVDFILAVGGGSVIDSAKAIGYGAANDLEVWDLYEGKKQITNFINVGTILTISAAGSEMSSGSVITNDETNIKSSYGHELSRPKFSILNPELTYTLPNYQTSCGGVDIIMHTFERFFTTKGPLSITDDISLSVINNIMKYLPIALKENNNYEARAEIMWVGSLSHNDLTGCGGVGDWATHCIEHTLSGEWDVAHGAGLSAIWGHWARYVIDVRLERFIKLANSLGIKGNTKETAIKAIEKVEEFFVSIDMPINVSSLGISLNDELCTKLANIATNNDKHTVGSFIKLTSKDIFNILNNAK